MAISGSKECPGLAKAMLLGGNLEFDTIGVARYHAVHLSAMHIATLCE